MVDVCYIGGFGRSGSTLLERMFSQASGACALGEVVWVWQRGILRDELCGCGMPFSKCEFWQAVGDEAFGGWHRVDAEQLDSVRARIDRMRHIPRLAWPAKAPAQAREYAAHLGRIYAAAAKVSGAACVIDSSKHPSTAFHLRLDPAISVRVVHVVRDSRGVAYSWTKTIVRPEAGMSQRRLMYRYPPWRSALLWNTNNLAFAALARLGVPTYVLGYERLLRDPIGSLERLAAFVGAPADPTGVFLDSRTVRLGAAHQLAGNPMKFPVGQVVLREDDAWRLKLPVSSRRTVSAMTFPLLARYGYLDRGRKAPGDD